jgi:predicted regulator of Ras-like GTPase activity (Roadblock/LC7/MglB family)
MNSGNGNNTNKSESLSQFLTELKEEGNFQGVLLSYRDGEDICSIFNENIKTINPQELSSMCASVLEGANNLRKLIGEEGLTKIVTELNSYTLIIVQCDKNVFLTIIADFNSRVNLILDSIEKYQKKIIFLY